jgi:hypothetical protein
LKPKLLFGVIALAVVILFELLPWEITLAIYIVIGATLGIFFRKAKRWARDGIAGVIVGILVGIFVDRVLPPIIDAVVQNREGIEVYLIKAIPYLIKALFIWGTVVSIAKRVRKLGKAAR